MKGRPKKYRNGKRILLFLDADLLTALDLTTNNRSNTINKLIKQHIVDTHSSTHDKSQNDRSSNI